MAVACPARDRITHCVSFVNADPATACVISHTPTRSVSVVRVISQARLADALLRPTADGGVADSAVALPSPMLPPMWMLGAQSTMASAASAIQSGVVASAPTQPVTVGLASSTVANSGTTSAHASPSALSTRPDSRVPQPKQFKRPNAIQLNGYMHYFGDGSEELDMLHGALSGAVLDVYIEWHLPGGRLEGECPPGWTRDDLRSVKNAAFRVPFEVLLWVARFALRHLRVMRAGTDTVTISEPRGGVHNRGHSNGCIAVSYLKKAMGALRLTCSDVAEAPSVVEAYMLALRELGQVGALKALPLLAEYRNAILRQCDPSETADVRTATWTVNAPPLMQRPCESVSMLHADLVIEPRQPRGEWSVPGMTKTTDGIEGRVNLWKHRHSCRLSGCTLHEALQLPFAELQAAACSPGVDGKPTLDTSCAVCLVWLSRRLQGLTALPRDGLHPLYQERDAAGNFTGRVVDPNVLVADLRAKMDAADDELRADGKSPMPAEGRVLYMARHGGIMQWLMDGYSIEWVAERARIPIATLLRFYRAHNIKNDVFETNGQFGNTQMALVCAHARSDGWLCTARNLGNLLTLCKLSLTQAAELTRPQLYERLAPLLACNVSLVSAAAALLRNANMQCSLRSHDRSNDGVIIFDEEEELSSDQLYQLIQETAHCDFLERCEKAPLVASAACSSSTALLISPNAEAEGKREAPPQWSQPTSPIFSPYLRDRGWLQLAARDPQLRSIFDGMAARGLQVAAPPSASALRVGDETAHQLPRVLLFAWPPGQGGGWLEGELCALNDNAQALLDGDQINIIAYYEADSTEAFHALKLEDYAQPREYGWLLLERNSGTAPMAARLETRSLESREYAELAGGTSAALTFSWDASSLPRLSTLRRNARNGADCGSIEVVHARERTRDSDVERAAIAGASTLSLRLSRGRDGSLGFSMAKSPRNVVDCVHKGGSAHFADLHAGDVIVSVNGEQLTPRLSASDALSRISHRMECSLTVVRQPSVQPLATVGCSAGATRKGSTQRRALFARTSLAGLTLPPVYLLQGSQAEVDARVDVRLQEQAILTGAGSAAVRKKMLHVMKLDLYLQAASGGYVGLSGGEVGGLLWTLSAHTTYFAMLLLDMTRIHDAWGGIWNDFFEKRKVAATRLANPRGGYQSDIFGAVTCADARKLLAALGIHLEHEDRASVDARLLRFRSDDPRLLAAEAVLNKVFALVIRPLHEKDGVFFSGLTSAELEQGASRLSVGPMMVKYVAGKLNSVTGRRRLRSAKTGTALVGWLTEGSHARTSKGETRSYSADYVKSSKRILAWYLKGQGWETAQMTRKLEKGEVAYTVVVALQTEIVRRAYYRSLSLSEKQRVFRAMAATEDVMQTLLHSKRLTVAQDLQTAVGEELSYRLDLRVSDVEGLDRDNFAYGQAETKADIEFNLDRHKGDSAGHGASRWLQHCQGCEFACLGPHNHDGRQWSLRSACGFQFSSLATPASRCPACLLLYLLSMQGDAPDDAPLFRVLVGGGGWSWCGGIDGCAEHFSTNRLQYEAFNALLHEDVLQANAWREVNLNLPPWPLAFAHWHMFRHGGIIMAIIFKQPIGELERSARIDRRTLESYRAHTGGLLSVLFDEAHKEDSVHARTCEAQCQALARRIAESAGDVDEAQLRDELFGMCDSLGFTPAALQRVPAGMRQLMVSGAAMYRPPLLSIQHVGPLQEELERGYNRHEPSMALEYGEVKLSTLVTSVDAALAAVSDGSEHQNMATRLERPSVDAKGGADDDAMEDGNSVDDEAEEEDEVDEADEADEVDKEDANDAATQAGDEGGDKDGESTQAGDLQELHLDWQDIYAEALAQVARPSTWASHHTRFE